MNAAGVITTEDVAAIRGQLGEPQDFADTDGEVDMQTAQTKPSKRLYRDEDGALLGGVLAGCAKYLNVQAVWVRLAFVLIAFMSFGTALIVYVVMWIIVPPARTAAEKLALEGKAATLSAIKERSAQIAQSASTKATARIVRDVMLFCLGLFCTGVAILSLLATIAGGLFLLTGGIGVFGESLPSEYFAVSSGYHVAASVLFIVSGVLFTILSSLLAIAAFRRVWTKRLGISVAAVVAAGIAAFATAFVPLVFGFWYTDHTIQQSYVTTQHELPESFASTSQLVFDLRDVSLAGTPGVLYTVSDTVRYELKAPDTMNLDFEVTQKGDVATMTLRMTEESMWRHYQEPMVYVYGPELDSLLVRGGTMKYVTKGQDNVSLDAQQGATIIVEGIYESVAAATEQNSSVLLDRATVQRLTAKNQGGWIEAGVVRTLDATQPTTCPAEYHEHQNAITLAGITGTTLRYNGTDMSTTGIDEVEQPCGQVTIDD